MAFLYKKGRTRELVKKIIANSEVIQVGEAVRLVSDFVVTCPAGSTIFGVVEGIVGPNGEVLLSRMADGCCFSKGWVHSIDRVFS